MSNRNDVYDYATLLTGLDFLINNATASAQKLYFDPKSKRWSKGVLTHNERATEEIATFLQAAFDFFQSKRDLNEEDNRAQRIIRTYYELFLNLEPNHLVPVTPMVSKHRPFTLQKAAGRDPRIPELKKDASGKYISFEDSHAHEHQQEGARIGASTQMERVRAWVSQMMAHLGIHVFETARYEELNYISTMIYANDEVTSSAQRTPSCYWIGHASNFIVIPPKLGASRPLHVLTDPVEGDLFTGVYSRQTKEGKLIKGHGVDRLPFVDVVVISHNHRDHVDTKTLARLVEQQPKMIVPEGDGALFKSLGFLYVEELIWGETAQIIQDGASVLDVVSVPARHWSGRGLHDAHHSAFAGYVLRAASCPNQDIYFAGDTAELGDVSSRAVYENFNVTLAIQPGGPDENRSDMESTHQSSADGISAHFKNILAHYQRLNRETPVCSKEQFFDEIQKIKTVYDHTATFKLGNLRLRDTYYSYNRVLAVFSKNLSEKQAQQFLAAHEFEAYQSIKQLAKQIKFANKSISTQEIARIIERDIIVPKIGQRLDLTATLSASRDRDVFDDRCLILNRRALESCDTMALTWLEQKKHGEFYSADNLIDHLITGVLSSYKEVWHAQWTRTHLNKFDEVMSVNADIKEKLTSLQAHLTYKERHGHLQNLIHYAQWLKNTVKTPYDLADYLNRLHVRRLVDHEIHTLGTVFIPMSRTDKINRFKDLANQLDKAESMQEYRQIYQSWLHDNKVFLTTNRSKLFSQSKTNSELALDKLENLINPKHG